jgi:hypothetical protein
MLKLGSRTKPVGPGGTPVLCPACRYPNLGIDIWCERCRMPLDWNGQKVAEASWTAALSPPAPAPASVPAVPSPVAAPEPPEPPEPPEVRPITSSLRRTPGPTFRLPRLTVPAIAWPRLTLPRITVPRITMPRMTTPRVRWPRVPRIAWIGIAILAVLLIAPLAYVLLPLGHPVASRQSATAHLPSTSGAGGGETPQAATIPGVEAKTGLRYSSGKCATNAACLTLASQTVGPNAAAVVFSTAGSAGRQCVGYTYKDGGRWHFLDAVCALPGQLSPLVGHDATVHVPGNCANVRNAASLSGGVIACLHDGTTVHIDGGPTYAETRLWWHETHGWIAHDFLIGP